MLIFSSIFGVKGEGADMLIKKLDLYKMSYIQ